MKQSTIKHTEPTKRRVFYAQYSIQSLSPKTKVLGLNMSKKQTFYPYN